MNELISKQVTLDILAEIKNIFPYRIRMIEQLDCALKEFGDCSYSETGCSDCTVKAKIRNTQKYKEESPEEIAADMASISPFEPETWYSLLKGLNRAGYIICKKI